MPIHCLWLSISCPISHAMIAAATGMSAENMLDFATPRFLMVLTQSDYARLEHKTARQIIGYHTSPSKYVS